MKAENLIKVLVVDTRAGPPVGRVLVPALVAGGLAAATALLGFYGLRPDLSPAFGKSQVLVKHLFGPLLGVAAAGAALRAVRPGARIGGWGWGLFAAVALVIAAFLFDLVALPAGLWPAA